MISPHPSKKSKAFTVMEALTVLVVVVFLVLVFLPSRSKTPATWTPIRDCADNLSMLGRSLTDFAEDHNGNFPPETSVTNGGSKEFLTSGKVISQFEAASWDPDEPWLLHCPDDKLKVCAASVKINDSDDKPTPLLANLHLDDRNLSYFMSINALGRSSQVILAGDRNLTTNGSPVQPGQFALTTNLAIGWSHEMHMRAGSPCGNILFADGHVETTDTKSLAGLVRKQPLQTNLLMIP